MNASASTTTTCPSWCEADHGIDWDTGEHLGRSQFVLIGDQEAPDAAVWTVQAQQAGDQPNVVRLSYMEGSATKTWSLTPDQAHELWRSLARSMH